MEGTRLITEDFASKVQGSGPKIESSGLKVQGRRFGASGPRPGLQAGFTGGYIGFMLGLYRENGKENGTYYSIMVYTFEILEFPGPRSRAKVPVGITFVKLGLGRMLGLRFRVKGLGFQSSRFKQTNIGRHSARNS